MPNYRYGDDAEYFTTYGQLRKWAEDCSEVKYWIKQHIPEALEEKQIQFKPRHFYRMGSGDGVYLLAWINAFNLQLVCVEGDRVGNHYGGSGSLESVQDVNGHMIIEDLGPDWLSNQLARKEKEELPF
jgi:hypothetical protein